MARLNNQKVIHEVYGTVGESWWIILGGKDGSYPRKKRALSQHNFMEYFESQSSQVLHMQDCTSESTLWTVQWTVDSQTVLVDRLPITINFIG